MTAIAGKDAKVGIGANDAIDLDSYSFSRVVDMLDETEFEDEDRTFLPGLAGGTATVSGNLNMADTNGQLAMWTASLNKTTVALRLYDDGVSFFSATAYVSQVDISAGVADKVTVSFQLTFTGAVAFT